MFPTSPIAVDLSDRTLIKISGADRTRYLQGQITNDLSLLPECGTLEACVCNAKGKLEAHIFVRELTEATGKPDADGNLITSEQSFYLVDADPALREDDTLLNRLNKYIIADDCEAVDVTGDYRLIHLIGPEGASALDGAACNRFGPAGRDFICSTLHDSFTIDLPLSTPEDLEPLRIAHGIPKWGAELTPAILPPEAGLQDRAISYTKGCYIGQEVISRIKSVGRVNKQLVTMKGTPTSQTTASSDPAAPLQPGLNLYTDNPEKPAIIGVLTSCSCDPALDAPVALGYVKREHTAPGTPVYAGTEANPLAYALEIGKSPLL